MRMLDFSMDDEPKFTTLNEPKKEMVETIATERNNITEQSIEKGIAESENQDVEDPVDTAKQYSARFVRPNTSTQTRETKEKKREERTVGRPATTNKRTIQAKAIPKDLLELARRDAGIPSSVSNSNAVAAYIYMKASDKANVTIPDELKEIIEECEGDQTVQDMNERISTVEGELRNISKKMDELSLALNYLVLNASGLSYENPNTAADVNLLEEGVLDIRNQIRKQTKELRRQDNNNGRPFR